MTLCGDAWSSWSQSIVDKRTSNITPRASAGTSLRPNFECSKMSLKLDFGVDSDLSALHMVEAEKTRELWAMVHEDDDNEGYQLGALHQPANQDEEDSASKQLQERAAECQQFQRDSRDFRGDFRSDLSRRILEFGGSFCGVDLFANDPCALNSQELNERCIAIDFFGLTKIKLLSYTILEPSPWFRKAKRKLWPKLVFCAYLASSAHLICYMYHQYLYDYTAFRLTRVQWLNNTQAFESLQDLQLEREDFLLEELARHGQELQSIGAPLMHLNFIVQCVCIVLLAAPLVSYVAMAAYYTFKTPFNFYFVRNFLDYAHEQRNSRRLVRDQVRRFLESSRNYTHALIEHSEQLVGEQLFLERYAVKLHEQQSRCFSSSSAASALMMRLTTQPMSRSPMGRGNQSGAGQFSGSKLDCIESLSCKQVRDMLNRGQLQPMNQAPGWVARQSLRFAAFATVCFSIAILKDLTIASILFYYRDPSRQLTLNDSLIFGNFTILIFICDISSLFYGSILICCSLDQATLAKKLRKLIDSVIELNNLRFYISSNSKVRDDFVKMRQSAHRKSMFVSSPTTRVAPQVPPGGRRKTPAPSSRGGDKRHFGLGAERQFDHRREQQLISSLLDASYQDKMNYDLLLALMHYKIFFAQLTHLRRSLRTVFAFAGFSFVTPIVGRLHLPYFKASESGDPRLLLVLLSVIIIIPVDFLLLPICYLHKRCLDLYKRLNCLLAYAAHTIDHLEGRDIYDRHLISMLHKEMCHPDQTTSQFVVKILNLKLTYASLVRLHFYFGFSILTLWSDNQASTQELSGTIFSDPLGFF